MICKLTLYQAKYLKEDKNFVIEDIDTYLENNHENKITINDFQFQRIELSKKIKVNLPQNNSLDFTSASKRYNYAVIKYTGTGADLLLPISYYYYIVNVKQISQSTLEYELKMDVLNTYKFVSSRTLAYKSLLVISLRGVITNSMFLYIIIFIFSIFESI